LPDLPGALLLPPPDPESFRLQDDPDNDWPDDVKAKYQQAGVQMVLGGKVTQNVREMVKRVLESEFCEGVTPEQGLVNHIFRG
jgi:hypothetical protein